MDSGGYMISDRLQSVFLLILCLYPVFTKAQNVKLSLATSDYIAGQPLSVNYSNLPGTPNNEFYLLFVFGGNGTDFYDSKPLKNIPEGNVEMKPLTRPGNYQFVIYRYKNYNDTRPQQVARIPFKTITPAMAASKKVPEKATVKSEVAQKPVEKPKPPVEIKKATPPKQEITRKEDKPNQTPKEPNKQPQTATVKKTLEKKTKEEQESAGDPLVRNNTLEKPGIKEDKEDEVIIMDEDEENIASPTSSQSSTGTYRASRIVIPRNINAKPPVTNYKLIAARTFDTNQNIILNFEFPALDSGKYYQVAISRPEDHSGINISRQLDTSMGTVTLNPLFEKGVYELRVLKGLTDAIVSDSVVYRQAIAIGTIDKTYPGRYTCWPKKPYIAGTSNPEAPQPDELMAIFTNMMATENVKPWLSLEDVCVEVQVIQYYPQTVVTFVVSDDVEEDIVYKAFPVRFVSRVVLNDYVNKKSTLAEETKDRYYYFYKNEQTGKWEYTLQPGVQFRPF